MRFLETCRQYAGAFLLVSLAVYTATRTVYYNDTDTFTLLAAGRALLSEGVIPSLPTYSFLEEGGAFYHYYWLFSLLLYGIESLCGFAGLLALKALLLTGTGWLVIKLLNRDQPLADTSALQLIAAAGVIFVISDRDVSLRAMYVSFLFIVLLSYILLYQRKMFFLLPILTIAWVNMHGIEWVVGAAICGAWGLQHLVDARRSGQGISWSAIGWVASCLPAMFLNPSGPWLLLAPFAVPADAHLYVSELAQRDAAHWLDFSTGLRAPLVCTLLALLFLVRANRVVDVGGAVFELTLLAAGIVLVLMGARFLFEAVLLSVPALSLVLREEGVVSRYNTSLVIALIVICLTWVRNTSPHLAAYPIDERSYPLASTQYVGSLPGVERYAIAPTFGGYAAWHLGPSVKIYADMQMPPHTAQHYFEFLRAELSSEAMDHFLDTHAPDVVGIPAQTPFPGNQRLAPVYYDQHLVIYLNTDRLPALAREQGLRVVNPHRPEKVRQNKLNDAIAETRKMLEQQPDNPTAQLVLLGYLVAAAEFDAADGLATELDNIVPGDVYLLAVKAAVAMHQQNYPDAITHLAALYQRNPSDKATGRSLAEAYYLNGDPYRAYQTYRTAINPYRDPTIDQHHLTLYTKAATALKKPLPPTPSTHTSPDPHTP